MKKLKLNLEELKVESFEATVKQNVKGTVNGNATIPPQLTCDDGCITSVTNPCHTEYPCHTDHWSCNGTCFDPTCQEQKTCFTAPCPC